MTASAFEFPGLPLSPIRPGQTVLVSGRQRLATRIAKRLVFGGDHTDGTIYVSTNESARTLLADVEFAFPDVDLSRVGIVDATGRGHGTIDTEARVERLSSTGDLTGISIKNSVIAGKLREAGIERVRTCFDSLSMLLLYRNFRTIVRFVHTMDGRIAATEGFGVFVFDPSMHEKQVRYSVQNLCDGLIEVRHEGETPEMRVEGLRNQPRGWQPFDLVSA